MVESQHISFEEDKSEEVSVKSQSPRFLHPVITAFPVNQRSSQGMCFIVTLPNYNEKMVLKIYGQERLSEFEKEVSILSILKSNNLVGFPFLISAKCTKETGEILLPLLGPNLAHLQRGIKDE